MTPEERAHRICMEWYESEHMELEQLRVAIVDAQNQALEGAAHTAFLHDASPIVVAAIRALKVSATS